jgi:parallel beta-helix repeat protein
VGIGIAYSSPHIVNNKIVLNKKIGIYCRDATPTIESNTIIRGEQGISCSRSTPSIKGNMMIGVSDTAVSLQNSNGSVANNLLLFNTLGGIEIKDESQPEIISNTIRYGGRDGKGVSVSMFSNPRIINNTITHQSNDPME